MPRMRSVDVSETCALPALMSTSVSNGPRIVCTFASYSCVGLMVTAGSAAIAAKSTTCAEANLMPCFAMSASIAGSIAPRLGCLMAPDTVSTTGLEPGAGPLPSAARAGQATAATAEASSARLFVCMLSSLFFVFRLIELHVEVARHLEAGDEPVTVVFDLVREFHAARLELLHRLRDVVAIEGD